MLLIMEKIFSTDLFHSLEPYYRQKYSIKSTIPAFWLGGNLLKEDKQIAYGMLFADIEL